MLNYTLKVINIKQETKDTFTYSFKQPGLKKIKYLAGQYLTLIFKINGRRYLRPYSFSSAPQVDSDLKITVKRMYNGIVSNHIIDKVNIGDLVEVIEPMGDFLLPSNEDLTNRCLVLWCSGSGITPLMSIAKHALHNNLVSHIILVYGNRNLESSIFSDEIKAMQQKYGSQFSVIHFHTQAVLETANPYLLQGRIAPENVLSILDGKIDLANTLHFICGPEGLKESIKNTLGSAGVSMHHVFSEDFEVTRNPKDFEDIFTQNVVITVNNQPSTVEVTKGKSILEAGLDSLLELSYSCQTGDCLLCKAYVTAGEVKMIGAKKSDLIEANQCLLCCSFPLTDNVNITIE